MKYEKYPIESFDNFLKHEFVSNGPKGQIVKLVEFEQVNKQLYNLSFGDMTKQTVDDNVVTNNKDSKKVLATVSSAVLEFFKEYPTASVIFAGNSPARTRLYRMAIGINFEELRKRFELFGIIDDRHYEFRKEGIYDAFLIRKKTLNFYNHENPKTIIRRFL